MKKKLQIAVIFGGRSGEHEVSLMSARSVLNALDPEKYETTQIGITHEGAWMSGERALEVFAGRASDALTPVILPGDPTFSGIYAVQGVQIIKLSDFDVVFPVLHGTYGEDGALQGLLEMADVAYVGAGVVGSAVGMDKGVFKDVMRAHEIPVVESTIALRSEIETDIDSVIRRAESVSAYPLFVKPANLGSSVGVSKCQSRDALVEGLKEAARYDRRVIIERGIDAREIEISVLGNDSPKASIAGEIIPSEEFYSYEAKYINGESELKIPAPLPGAQAEVLRAYAVKAFQAIDCAGLARVDFLVDKNTGEFYLNEVNTMPGFTEISMYPKLWEASGLPYAALLDELIALALERKAERDKTERRFRRES
jgi:D-alanine-D-alanine ligase